VNNRTPRGEVDAKLRDLALLFTKLGFVAFGGPAAHIAMMRAEIVGRRRWMGEQEFLDLMGASNLIPGPNSTELAIHIGRVRAGWRGLLVAGTCFILPAFLIVLAAAVLLCPLRVHTTGGGASLRHNSGRGGDSRPCPLGVPEAGGEGTFPSRRWDRGAGTVLCGSG
jgi:hypothetical protein